MIIDTLDNLGKYVALNPLFADVVEFLKRQLSHQRQGCSSETLADQTAYERDRLPGDAH